MAKRKKSAKNVTVQEVEVEHQEPPVSVQEVEVEHQEPPEIESPEAAIEEEIVDRSPYHAPPCPWCGPQTVPAKRPKVASTRGGIRYLKCRRCGWTWKD